MKKTFCIFLIVVILFCVFNVTSFAEEFETDKLLVEITTDKEGYSLFDKVVFNVKVTNVSDEVLKDVQIQTYSRDLARIKGPTWKLEEELAPGECIELSDTAVAVFGAENTNFLDSVLLFFLRPDLLSWYYTVFLHLWCCYVLNPSYDYGVVYTDKTVGIGRSNLTFKVQTSYTIGEHDFGNADNG